MNSKLTTPIFFPTFLILNTILLLFLFPVHGYQLQFYTALIVAILIFTFYVIKISKEIDSDSKILKYFTLRAFVSNVIYFLFFNILILSFYITQMKFLVIPDEIFALVILFFVNFFLLFFLILTLNMHFFREQLKFMTVPIISLYITFFIFYNAFGINSDVAILSLIALFIYFAFEKEINDKIFNKT